MNTRPLATKVPKAAAAATATLLACGAVQVVQATPAHAQKAILELSSGSSNGSSSKPQYDMDPDDPSIKAKTPDKPALGSAYTGIAPISLTIGAVVTAVVVQLLVDAVPPLRQAVDQAAAQAGLQHAPGSSEGNRIFPVQQWLAMLGNIQLPALP